MLSNDALAMLMLCSKLGLSQDSEYRPLSLRSWNPLVRKIQTSSLNRPGALLGLTAEDLAKELQIDEDKAETIANLVDRSGMIAIELERLQSIGINILTRADNEYPERYRLRLKQSAPPILFYAGVKELLGQQGIAIVGSRDINQTGELCAGWIGNACGLSGMVLYSGGARGVDSISMLSSLDARGFSVGVMANNMDRSIRTPEYRRAIKQGNLCIVTPYLPSAPFNVGLAMGRNRLIYTLADYGIVVASSAKKGGTWSGATENMKNEWIPLFVAVYKGMPEGNQLLIDMGGIPLPIEEIENYSELVNYLEAKSNDVPEKPTQPPLF